MTIAAERDGWSVLSFPFWHSWPQSGNVRALGPTRRRWKRFAEGQLYSKKQIQGWVWTDNRGVRRLWEALPDSARFRCDQEASCFRFSLIEAHDPLLPAADARAVMKELDGRGLSAREVARRTGVSPATTARAARGVGKVRLSTVILLDELASSLNGHR